MTPVNQLRAKVAQWPYSLQVIMASLASFGTYTCMYAFRKAFAAGTYSNLHYWHVDYKIWLVIAQVAGYTLSKFYGIRFIAEVKSHLRAKFILLLISISWLALLAFAIIPAPYNIICLFVNGFPLGMIWGLVFSYLEGRRSTEFMASVLSISLIFASGFVKTTARTLMSSWHVSEYLMPFLTGAVFILPLLIFLFCLELMPQPSAADIKQRAKRAPMNAADRKTFVFRFLPGLLLTVIIYVLLTIMRDVRDNFEVEIWAGLGIHDNGIFTRIDSIISLIILAGMSLLILVKNNLNAFSLIHFMIIGGCILAGLATILFYKHEISPVTWMTLAGLGLYMGYVPYNAIFFERMIATFNYRSNVGFVMYIADAAGYLGSVSVLLVKEFGKPGISWGMFFKEAVMLVGVIGAAGGILSLLYFTQSSRKQKRTGQQPPINIYPA
jgi:hypothetical protein